MEPFFIPLAAILVLGTSAQWIAWRIKLPSIVILLLLGFLAGPITGFLKPDHVFGELLFPIVSISVAIILFEGGLSLKITELKQVGKVVRNLNSIGVLITWIFAALGAWFFLKFDFAMATLLGAILTVTGPTVIVPLLRHLRLSGRVSSVLKWEAMVIDPIGALLAILVFEAILAGGVQAATSHAVLALIKTLFFGLTIGFLAAQFMIFVLKKYLIPDFLHNAFSLMMVITSFGLSNYFQAESGLLVVTVMGIILANQNQIKIQHIVEFKENLRVLLIPGIFIILGARLQPYYVNYIGWQSVLFLVFLIIVVRPLGVFACTVKSDLGFKEKLFLASMAPRGIIAAAVSSIFALHLDHAGYPGAEQLVAITFFVIIGTVVFYGITGPLIAKIAGVSQPNPQGILILGAHHWARLIGQAIHECGVKVMMIDTNRFNVTKVRAAGMTGIYGNLFSEGFLHQLDLGGIGKLLALTSNDEVNSLAALHCAEYFGRAEIYQLRGSESDKKLDALAPQLHGRFLFSKTATYGMVNDLIRSKGKVEKIQMTKDYDYKVFQDEHQDRFLPLFIVTETKQIKVMTAETPPVPSEGQTLIAIVHEPLAGS